VSKKFFSEEKNQKTLILGAVGKLQAMAGILPRTPETKVFWAFYSEKNLLPL